MTDISVACEPAATEGWTCRVRLADGGRTLTEHDVGVRRRDLERLAPGAADPTDLVRRSFEFLLEREPPSSILRSFELPLIGRYFPEYESRITEAGGG